MAEEVKTAESTTQAPTAEPKTTESAPAPVVETKAAPEPSAKPAVAVGGGQPWERDRIRVLTAKLSEKSAQLAAVQAKIAGEPGADAAIVEQRASEIANQRLQLRSFSDACSVAAQRGKELYGEDFQKSLNSLLLVAGRDERGQWIDEESMQRYNAFLVAALDTGEAPKVLHELGRSQDDAARILALPPTKQAVELTKLALRLGEPEPAPSLPKPLSPVGRAGSSDARVDPADPTRADALDSAAWFAARQAQVEAREQGSGGDRRRRAGY